MKASLGFGLKGRVESIQVLERGIIVREYDGFDNLILDNGLEMVAFNAVAALFSAAAIGTGNTVPANNQVALTSEAARTQTLFAAGTTNSTPETFIFSRTFDFIEGTLNGNYTELGFSNSSTANAPLFSRVLIQSSGVPTAITVTSTQRLRVKYSLTVTFGPTANQNFNVNFGGNWGAVAGVSKLQRTNNENVLIVSGSGAVVGGYGSGSLEPSQTGYMFVSTSNAVLAAVGSQSDRQSGEVFTQGGPPGSGPPSIILSPYIGNSKQRKKTVSFDVNTANHAFGSFGLGPAGSQGFTCVPSLVKTKSNLETVTLEFTLSWARV